MDKYQKELSELIKNLPKKRIFGPEDILVAGISDDSRKIQKGDLFVAIAGLTHDAHRFIPEVIKKGAKVVVGEKLPPKSWLKGITYVQVLNSREALAYLASSWYDEPSKKLTMIGVTGTDGKTTTASMIYKILEHSGKKVGLFTTLGAQIGKKVYDTGAHVTNPEPLELHKILNLMVSQKCQFCVLEVTSQGIDQERIAGIDFDTAILTNITHEHLKYHKTLEAYRDVKLKLFQNVKNAVLNKDDQNFSYILGAIPPKTRIYSYSINQDADFRANDVTEQKKLAFNLVNKDRKVLINLNFPGQFNVYNSLAAIAVARIYKIAWKDIENALDDFSLPQGRLEEVKNNLGIKIFIDFAHTPNSLQNVLKTLRPLSKGKLIAVFGCASERDDEKRPIMGEIAGSMADVAVLTSEDPRNENMNKIIDEITMGAKRVGANELTVNKFDGSNYSTGKHYFIKMPERGEAIRVAINKVAQKNDLVVICGKGHEKSMNIKGTEYPWSDHEAVKMALKGKVKKIL